MDNYYFENSETFEDPLYGQIEISPFEKRVISTPEFQRLREIKQLGFVKFVYHTAEHSRFAHSIGVCHRVKKLIDQVNKNITQNKRYQVWRKEGINNPERAKSEGYQKIDTIRDAERIIITACALLHDLSHAPFSHEIESPNSKLELGIPKHDQFDKNPALFKYLFDEKHSILARVIRIYNTSFWELLKNDIDKWLCSVEDENGNFTNYWHEAVNDQTGMLAIKNTSEGATVRFDEKFPIIGGKNNEKYKELPILGVMIFEVLLFDKPKNWVNRNASTRIDRIKTATPIKVKTDWNSIDEQDLSWRPLYGWFRPYRKDLIGNTICADLMDYLDRDGRETGIVSSLDFKFLDRMAVTRAALFSDEDGIELNLNWEDIPETCEHIVFDVYDQKRGFIRDSVITEILACLEARYQLAERVYEHRMVEGARSMLKEISYLLSSIGILKLDLLHTCMLPESEYNHDQSGEPILPTADETFLSWVISLRNRPDYISNKVAIDKAISLARCIKNRRIYREAIIIDGIHGYTKGSKAGNKTNCESLASVLIPETKEMVSKLEQWKEDVSNEIKAKYNGDERLLGPLVTVGVRKWGKRFKLPLVLIATPFNQRKVGEVVVTPLDIQPLFACKDPDHINIQIEAMKKAYDGLWRVYLFIHPVFHSKEYENLHKKVSESFLSFLKTQTPVEWRNSIHIEYLLPEDPLDISEFVENSERKKNINKFFRRFIKESEKKLTPEVSQAKNRTVSDEEIEKFVLKMNPTEKEFNFLKYEKNHSSFFHDLKGYKFSIDETTGLGEKNATLFRQAASGKTSESEDILIRFLRSYIATNSK